MLAIYYLAISYLSVFFFYYLAIYSLKLIKLKQVPMYYLFTIWLIYYFSPITNSQCLPR